MAKIIKPNDSRLNTCTMPEITFNGHSGTRNSNNSDQSELPEDKIVEINGFLLRVSLYKEWMNALNKLNEWTFCHSRTNSRMGNKEWKMDKHKSKPAQRH